MRRYATIIALASSMSCGTRDERTPVAAPIASPLPPPPTAPPIVEASAPHGSEISIVAATEQGDAALTIDLRNSVRLWPALDGTRMPIPIRVAGEIAQAALVHAGGLPGGPGSTDLVAALRDSAGGVALLRLGIDGSQKSRVQLPGTSYVSVAIAAGGVLALTSDHALAWYALDGTPRGTIVADAGQQIVELATRHDRAAVIVREGDALFVRWVSLAEVPRWEPAVKLPTEVRPGAFAIAPHARRIAYLDSFNLLHVDDVGLQLTSLVGNERTYFGDPQSTLGFLDDDTVGAPGFRFAWWTHRTDATETAAVSRVVSSDVPGAAFADSMVVSASNGELVLATPTQVRYVGWSTPAVGSFVAGDHRVVLAQSSTRFSWIDDDLRRTSSIDLREVRGDSSWVYGQPIGDHHIVYQRPYGEHSDIDVVDAMHPDTKLRVVDDERVDQYFAADDMLGVKAGTKLRRFKLDLTAMTVAEQLPRVPLRDYSISWARVFDPARANGVAAIVMSWERESSTRQTLTTWRVVGDKLVPTRDRTLDGQVVRSWPDGTLAMFAAGQLVMRRGDQTVKTVKAHSLRLPVAISDDMSRIAFRDATDVHLLDGAGTELWHAPMWGAQNVMFSPSGTRVFASGVGGLIAFDATNGRPVARECGFEFGVHDKQADIGPLGMPTVCEDPLLH